MAVAAILVKTLVGVLFAGLIIILLWAYKGSLGVYDEYIEPLDEREFKLKRFLPMGLFLYEKISFSKFIPRIGRELFLMYSSHLSGKLVELYGAKYSEYYISIYTACQWSIFLLGTFVGIIFAGINCLNGELKDALLAAVLSPIVGLGLIFLHDNELKGKIVKRRLLIQMEFPEFINKLLLLVNAGMTISRAWEKIIAESKKKTPLYEELNASLAEVRAGKSVAAAYEDFARRCKVREIVKFVSVIILNLRKGGAEVVPTLRMQSDECWEMRKTAAKRLGEQASSKLMMPIAIMLLGIIMVVALPAVLQISNIN